MTFRLAPRFAAAALAGLLAGSALTFDALAAQGTLEDYRRALSLEERYAGLVVNVADGGRWAEGSNLLFYRLSTPGGHRFFRLDPERDDEPEPAFDHAALASELSRIAGGTWSADSLPFAAAEPLDGAGSVVGMVVEGSRYRCTLSPLRCESDPARRRGFPPGGGMRGGGGDAGPLLSPDGRLEALIEDHNVVIRDRAEGKVVHRTRDGVEGDAYRRTTLSWSPDSRILAAYRIVPGFERQVHYVESSPPDQLQPRHFTRNYTKPGDRLDLRRPVLIDPERGVDRLVDPVHFPDAYALSPLVWREDGREVVFEYNERGHGTFRVLAIDPVTAATRVIIEETTESFFYYRPSSGDGKYFRHDIDDGREIVWMSERDGWNHLYRIDGETGAVLNRITEGEWVVRDVLAVDEEEGVVWFTASGMDEGKDPYHLHLFRIGLDGSGLVRFTEEDGTHTVSLSPDRSHYLLSRSRVDLPPITQVRRTADRALVAEIGRGDHSALLAAGWIPPEPFVAKGRDGETDIWGIIVRPSTFDSTISYPVIESIYAGPHSHHVPKEFAVFPTRGMLPQAEVGFIVVMIDGMGTSNRSKAFHDVAWKNLGDAGFPDRILWHRAVAARYPYYDLGRVGIYGGSAGGQNAMGGLLFHPEFYHAAVADNGCHDNRMDKIWWNELWMGYPAGDHYDRSSNVVNAHLLRGKLLLTVGELDSNVDPSSTYQVVDALVRAEKEFEFLMIPGGEHARGPYHERKRLDFFVRHFWEMDGPDWNGVGLGANEE